DGRKAGLSPFLAHLRWCLFCVLPYALYGDRWRSAQVLCLYRVSLYGKMGVREYIHHVVGDYSRIGADCLPVELLYVDTVWQSSATEPLGFQHIGVDDA